MKMQNEDWKNFFLLCSRVLGKGAPSAASSDSWCSWTTFRRLMEDAGYWGAGLPNPENIFDCNVGDGGTWGQPFAYSDIAHMLIPREFYWEKISEQGFESGTKHQDIDALSAKLNKQGIHHRKTNLVLEIKLY